VKQRDLMTFKNAHCIKIAKQNPEIATSFHINERLNDSSSIQLELYENIDRTDTALERLNKSKDTQAASELLELNSKLNILLHKLFNHLDETVQENASLKEQLGQHTSAGGVKASNFDDYREDNSLSPDGTENQDFAPLDLPVFDLETLGGTSSN